MLSTILSKIRSAFKFIRENRFDRGLMKYFDWPLLINVLVIALFGVVCIFSATSSQVTETPANVVEMVQTQSLQYPRLQLIWIGVGLVAMVAIMCLSYKVYEQYADLFYAGNIALLLFTLVVAKAGRGGMTAFLSWGNDRGFQTSEVGKIAIIIALAKAFRRRKKPIVKLRDSILLLFYIGVPLVLIIAQPDVGTALVYLAIFVVLVWVSGTDIKLIGSILLSALILMIPVWYYMNNSAGGGFRSVRILMWLNPSAYPDEARQVINGQIAIGSGGLFGKGIVSPGSFASLGYISDDHTDFIFAIVCESFGLVGGLALIFSYVLLIGRLIMLSLRVKDAYGSFLIIGVTGMLLFHIVENVCMVIGLLPVTGIPLPFVSYGGSNMITNMMGIGLVENVVMRSRAHEREQHAEPIRAVPLQSSR